MKRLALQNKSFRVLLIAFRAHKVLGTFEKQVPDVYLFVLHGPLVLLTVMIVIRSKNW